MDDFTKSKLIILLRLLTEEEFKLLEKWLSSGLKPKNKKVLHFYKLLKRIYPQFEPHNLQKATFYKKIFSGKAFDNKAFNRCLSVFIQRVEDFLVYLRIQKEQITAQHLLSKELLARNQKQLFEDNATQLINQLSNKTTFSAKDYLRLYELNEAIYFQPSEHQRFKIDSPPLKAAINHLDAFYLLEKHKLINEVAVRSNMLKDNKEDNLTAKATLKMLAHLQVNNPLSAVELYEFRAAHQYELNWEQYQAFKLLFQQHFPKLDPSLQQDFLFRCINDMVALNSKGENRAIAELHFLYQFGLAQDLLLQHGKMTGVTFNNIILTACHEADYAFLKSFVKTYPTKLPAHLIAHGTVWAKAHLAYVLGNYPTCHDLLKDKMPEQSIYALQTRLTLFKANFEWVLNDATQQTRFKNFCLALEKYISRNKLHATQRNKATQRCIQLAKRIANLHQTTFVAEKWTALLVEINQEENLFGKSWLEKIIRNLIKTKVNKSDF